MKEISQHYKIPIITLQDILESGKNLLEGELLEDYIKELPLIEEYINNGAPKAIDEPLKLFY